MAITLTDLLDEKRVILGLRSRKMPNALREIIDLLAQNGKIDNPEAFFEKVLAREQAHPSVVENSAVFPHARTDLLMKLSSALDAVAPGFHSATTEYAPA